MLHEIELLVARLDGEVLTLRRLVRALGSKRWIGEDHFMALTIEWLVNRVTQINVWLDAMQEEIHQRQAPRSGNKILSIISAALDPLGVTTIKRLCFVDQPLVSAHEEASSAARGIADCETSFASRIGLHHSDN